MGIHNCRGFTQWKHDLPYCFIKLEVPRHQVWLPLGRNYKPIGLRDRVWVDYDDYVEQAIEFKRNPGLLKGDIWHKPEQQDHMLWLCNDAEMTPQEYFRRLALVLMRSSPVSQHAIASHRFRIVEREAGLAAAAHKAARGATAQQDAIRPHA